MRGWAMLCVAIVGVATASASPRATVSAVSMAAIWPRQAKAEASRSRRVLSDHDLPCDHPPPSWVCNTTEFCADAEACRDNGCWFLPQFCSEKCYVGLTTLAHSDCMEHPSDPLLAEMANKLQAELK